MSKRNRLKQAGGRRKRPTYNPERKLFTISERSDGAKVMTISMARFYLNPRVRSLASGGKGFGWIKGDPDSPEGKQRQGLKRLGRKRNFTKTITVE